MFRSRKTKPLLFSFEKDVTLSLTSYFVFFSFLALWLDEKNKVLAFELIRPFRAIIPAPVPFRKLIEIPLSEENKFIVDFFGRRERFK